jgi:CheY-like chemotaxis protein
MPKVLVVDDLATDRCLVGGILESDSILEVRFASNGAEALRKIRDNPPGSAEPFDLVVTDLQMPEMDGLELVDAVRRDYPQIPVILITAHGSEALAVEALERGAASYVPKSHLTVKLLDTVEQILSLPRSDADYQPLVSCLRDTEFRFALNNDKALIEPLLNLSRQVIEDFGLCDANGRMRVAVALEEALLNAMYRGNLEISREQMQEVREHMVLGQGLGLMTQRRSQAPYRQRQVQFQLHATPDEARFVIRDEGPGFDVMSALDPGDPEQLNRDSGRGLVLMRTFMDEVFYNERGNEVTLVKRREAATPSEVTRV